MVNDDVLIAGLIGGASLLFVIDTVLAGPTSTVKTKKKLTSTNIPGFDAL
jgi:hypothetical protein